MTFIFVMSSQEKFPSTPGFSASTLAVAGHLVLYGTLALLLCFAIDGRDRTVRTTHVVAITLAILYGVSDELHQSFVPGRHATAFDLAVNAVGATVAVLVWANRRALINWVTTR